MVQATPGVIVSPEASPKERTTLYHELMRSDRIPTDATAAAAFWLSITSSETQIEFDSNEPNQLTFYHGLEFKSCEISDGPAIDGEDWTVFVSYELGRLDVSLCLSGTVDGYGSVEVLAIDSIACYEALPNGDTGAEHAMPHFSDREWQSLAMHAGDMISEAIIDQLDGELASHNELYGQSPTITGNSVTGVQ